VQAHARVTPLISPTWWTLRRREAAAGIAFAMPAMLGFLLWVVGPMLASLYMSFTDWRLIRPPTWVGTANYERMISDDLFWQALKVTAAYTIVAVPLMQAASLGLAMLLNQKIRGVSVFRSIFYLPVILPAAAVALVWLWFLNPTFGVINYFLARFGLPPSLWLYDETMALPSFWLMGLWATGGTAMLIYLAGLQGVPRDLLDAASVDGAGALRRFRHVVIPMISPVILFNTLTSILATFQIFTQAYLMTRGGPNNATLFYVLYIYRRAFETGQMGYAAALGWAAFLILVVISILFFRFSSARVYYELQRR
jgi:multiple sugar transport system permease protein